MRVIRWPAALSNAGCAPDSRPMNVTLEAMGAARASKIQDVTPVPLPGVNGAPKKTSKAVHDVHEPQNKPPSFVDDPVITNMPYDIR